MYGTRSKQPAEEVVQHRKKRKPNVPVKIPVVLPEKEPREVLYVPSEWLLGDLVWARVGKYPYWPCMITNDPELQVFTKAAGAQNKSSGPQQLHVHFFADNGRRSWVFSTRVLKFEGKYSFEAEAKKILPQMKKRDRNDRMAFIPRSSSRATWEQAVEEAEGLLNKTRDERKEFFKPFLPKAESKVSPNPTQGSPPKKANVAVDDSPHLPPHKRVTVSYKPRSKKPSKQDVENAFLSFKEKHHMQVLQKHPEFSTKEVEGFLDTMWGGMEEKEKLRYVSKLI